MYWLFYYILTLNILNTYNFIDSILKLNTKPFGLKPNLKRTAFLKKLFNFFFREKKQQQKWKQTTLYLPFSLSFWQLEASVQLLKMNNNNLKVLVSVI